MSRRNQIKGRIGECAARFALQTLGVKCLQQIATPVVLGRMGRVSVVKGYGAKVAGDFMGLTADGRGVLVEVKRRDEVLVWSDFEAHQHEALAKWVSSSGVALVVWVSGPRVFIMRYTDLLLSGFKPLHGIVHARAIPLHMERI
jgi:hypothetical protein